jgi:putative transposase
VFARGVDRQAIFRDDDDRQLYLRELARVVGECGWRCLGFCLMNNHLHLLIETPEPNIAKGMQLLHGRYARKFNDRHGRVGHLFQGRYGSKLIADDAQLWTAAAYLALNPVAARFCVQPEDWPWSSHALIVRDRAPKWLDRARLMELFGVFGGSAEQRYEVWVDGRCAMARAP